MPRVIRRHWRGMLATAASLALVALLAVSVARDALGQVPPAAPEPTAAQVTGGTTVDYVTEEELVQWGYAQTGKLILKYWVPVVGFFLIWTWRVFTWQTKTSQAIEANRTATVKSQGMIKAIADALITGSVLSEEARTRLTRKVFEMDD